MKFIVNISLEIFNNFSDTCVKIWKPVFCPFSLLNWFILLVQSEVNFLGRLSHPNLVKLLGYCWEDTELLLVYEFMQKGSLENHLFGSENQSQTLSVILQSCTQAFIYLHCRASVPASISCSLPLSH